MDIAQISYRLSAELVNSSTAYPTITPEGIVSKIKAILDDKTDVLGDYQSHKLDSVKKIGDLFIKCVYQLHYQESTLEVIFIYIKPSDLWQIQSFNWKTTQKNLIKAA